MSDLTSPPKRVHPYLSFYATLLLGLLSCVCRAQPRMPPHIESIVQGITGPAFANVHARLKASQTRITAPKGEKHLAGWQLNSIQDVQEALQPFGYFKPEVKIVLRKLQRGGYQAIYTITPGPLLRITAIHIQLTGPGHYDANLQKVLQTLPIQCGQAMTTENWQQAKQFVFEALISEGYLKATWQTRSAKINSARTTATLHLALDTGPQHTIGPISFQPGPLDAHFLQRYLPFQSGDPYKLSKVLDLQEILQQTDYFQKVSLEELQTRQPLGQIIPIRFLLTPAPAYCYTTGFGFSRDTGLRFRLGWLARRITKTGHRAAITSQLSQAHKNVILTYTFPGHQPATQWYHIQFERVERSHNQNNTLTQQLGLAYSDHQPNWSRTGFLTYRIDDASHSTPSNQCFLTPGFKFHYHYFDQPKSHYQYKFDLHLYLASHYFMSSTSFLQISCRGAWLHWLNAQNHILLRSRLGYTFTTLPDHLPPSLLFYAGGSNLRGFTRNYLGPGCHRAILSIEYRRRLQENLFFTVFLDSGDARHYFPLQFHKGAGVGLIWHLPMGVAEFSLAKPLSLVNDSDNHWRFLFNVGIDLL